MKSQMENERLYAAKLRAESDQQCLCDIYPAREQPIPGVTSKLIYDNLKPGVENLLPLGRRGFRPGHPRPEGALHQEGQRGEICQTCVKGVVIKAKTAKGAFYGMQSFMQLLPAQIESCSESEFYEVFHANRSTIFHLL